MELLETGLCATETQVTGTLSLVESLGRSAMATSLSNVEHCARKIEQHAVAGSGEWEEDSETLL